MKKLEIGLLAAVLLAPAGGEALGRQDDDAWVEAAEVETPQFFSVLVTDIEASVAWYTRAFALKEVERSRAEDGAWEIVNLTNDRLFVEIVRDNRARDVDRSLGIRKVGFHVPDVRVVADRVERATGERPRVLDFARFGVRILQVRDPDGAIVQLFSDLENPR